MKTTKAFIKECIKFFDKDYLKIRILFEGDPG